MKKWKRYTLRSFSVLLVLYLLLFTSISSFAAPQNQVIEEHPEVQVIEEDPEIQVIEEDPEMMMFRSTGSGNATLFVSAGQWVADNFYEFCNWVAHGYVSLSYDAVGDNVTFHWWLDNEADPEEAQEFEDSEVEITSDGNYNVPQNVQQTVLNYIQYRIQQNPLTYVETRIPSYNYLDPTPYPNYNMYKAVKDYMSTHDGYHVICGAYGYQYNNLTYITIATFSKSANLAWIGGVSSTKQWSTVYPYINWVKVTSQNFGSNIVSSIRINANGSTQSASSYGIMDNVPYSNQNFAAASGLNSKYPVFTSATNNEYVYVFNNLNAYKNFNTGSPQPYYFTEQGLSTPVTQWTASGGSLIAGGNLQYYGQTYSTITSQTQTGWTAEEVLALVSSIMGSGQGGGSGGSGGSSSDFDLGFLGVLGSLIGSLITGIGNLLTGIAEGIVNVIVGSDGNGGIIGMLRNLISNITDLVDSDFNGFLSDIFSWLPVEIVTLFTGVIVFGLFFGILKIIRG